MMFRTFHLSHWDNISVECKLHPTQSPVRDVIIAYLTARYVGATSCSTNITSLTGRIDMNGNIPLFHYSVIPLFHYSIIPLFHYSIIPLFHYSIIPLFHYSVIHNS